MPLSIAESYVGFPLRFVMVMSRTSPPGNTRIITWTSGLPTTVSGTLARERTLVRILSAHISNSFFRACVASSRARSASRLARSSSLRFASSSRFFFASSSRFFFAASSSFFFFSRSSFADTDRDHDGYVTLFDLGKSVQSSLQQYLDQHDKSDADHDGYVSKSEAGDGPLSTVFDRVDQDHDGRLSRDEVMDDVTHGYYSEQATQPIVPNIIEEHF